MASGGTGIVSWIDAGGGCGFITPARGGRDLFYHLADSPRGSAPLFVGAAVEFKLRDGVAGRLAAIEVVLRSDKG